MSQLEEHRRPRGGLGGATVMAFESRRATEMAGLIRRHGGVPVVAPAVREAPLPESSAARGLLGRPSGERSTVSRRLERCASAGEPRE